MSLSAAWSRRDLSNGQAAWILGGLVAGSWFLRGLQTRAVRSPWVFPDELIYSSLARSVATTGQLAIRGVHTAAYSNVYPLLISGSFVGRNPMSAYEAAKWTNALLMSLAAVPVFLLARRLLPNWLSLVATGLALLIPSMSYTGLLLTENAFYPLFLVAMLAIVRALESPTVGRQIAALGAILLAFLTRAEGAVLLPILLLAIVLLGLSTDRNGDGQASVTQELRRFRPTFVVVALGVAAVLVTEGALAKSPSAAFGIYATTVHGYSIIALPRWVASLFTDVEIYLGVLPFVPATIAASSLLWRRNVDRTGRAVAAASVACVVCLVLLVAALSSERTSTAPGYPSLPPRLHERYVFYVAPFYLILFLYWLHRRREFSNRLLGVLLALAALLPLSLPYAHVLTNADFEALALLPWNNTLIAERHATLAMMITACLLSPLLFIRRSSFMLLQVGLVGGVLFIAGQIAARAIRSASVETASSHVRMPSWIDRAVPRGTQVAVLWKRDPNWSADKTLRRERALWRAEFFNASVRQFFYLGSAMLYDLPVRPARMRDGHVLVPGSEGIYRYVLAASSVRLDGNVVGRDRKAGLVLYRLRDSP